MRYLTSAQALQLAADFALAADYIRVAEATDSEARASFLETASRAGIFEGSSDRQG